MGLPIPGSGMREAVGTLAPRDATALPSSLPERAVRSASPVVVAWRRLARNPLALLGSLVAVGYIVLGLVGPMFAPYDYAKQNLLQANLPPLSQGHLLGTDQVGRDLLSRLVTGVRISLRCSRRTTTRSRTSCRQTCRP